MAAPAPTIRHNAYPCRCQTEGIGASSSSSSSASSSSAPHLRARVCSERLIGVDCEMVTRAVVNASPIPLLARVSLVNCAGEAILDQFVHQSPEGLDYGTDISGVEAEDLIIGGRRGAITFEEAQAMLRPLLLEQSNIIVGHALINDFAVIGFGPPAEFVRDSTLCPFLCPDPRRPRGLAQLTKEKLGIDLRAPDASHDSVDDAWAAMQLFLSVRDRWEAFMQQQADRVQEVAAAAAAGDAPEPSPEPAARSFAPQQALKTIMLQYHIRDIFMPVPAELMQHVIPAAFDSAEHYAHILRPLIVEESRTSCARTLQLLSQTEEPGGLANVPIEAGVTAITSEHGFMHARLRILHSPHQDAAAAAQLLPFTLCLVLESTQAVDLGARLKHGVSLKGAGFDDFPSHLFVLIGGEWEPKSRRKGQKPRVRKGEVDDRAEYYTFSADEHKAAEFLNQFQPDHPANPTKFCIVPLESTITAIRADEALQKLRQHLNTPECIASILSGRVGADADADAEAEAMDDKPAPFAFRSELDRFCHSQKLNESQQTAITAAADSLSAPQGITLVQGPPGTGKTSTCTALLSMLTGAPCDNRGPLRVLCCAPTNVAVREIAKRFTKCFLFSQQQAVETDAVAADGSASSSSASARSKPAAAALALQFASFLEGHDGLNLDLSQLLLIGVKKDVEPFGIERMWVEQHAQIENDVEDDDEEQKEINEELADEGRVGGEEEFDAAESSEDDDDDGDAPQPGQRAPTLHAHHHALSSIFLDHRERRLQLLFERVRSQLIGMRNSKLFDSSFLPSVLQFADKQEGDRSTMSKQRIAIHLKNRVAQWKEMAAACSTVLRASFDLPRMGPVPVLQECVSPITPDSGRDQLRTSSTALLEALTRMEDAAQANEQRLRENFPKVVLRDVQSEAQLFADLSISDAISSARRAAHSAAGQLEQLVDWWQLCLSQRRWIHSVLLLNARIVFSTVSCSARACIRQSEEAIDRIQHERQRARPSHRMQLIHPAVFRIRGISAVIIDEAAQLLEAQLAITFTHKIERYFLIGDTEQLPAVVMSPELKQLHFQRSLYERLQRLHSWPVFMLARQYRMHPDIASFSNAEFYNGQIIDDESCSARPPAPWTSRASASIRPHVLFDRAMSFVNVRAQGANGTGESQDALQSWYNELEEKVLVKLLHELVHRVTSAKAAGYKLVHPISVGIVSPYRRQTLNLQRAIDREFPSNSAHGGCLSIQVATVDAFQGQERQVLFFTAVRSNPNGNIGFTNSRPRLNVALTRAQQLLVVLGDAATLTKREPLWQSFAKHCAKRGWTIQAHELAELGKILSERSQILKAMAELMGSASQRSSVRVMEENGFALFWSDPIDNALRSMPAAARRRWMEVFLQLKLGSFPVGALAKWARRMRSKGLVGLRKADAERLLGVVHPWTIHGFVLVWSLELRKGPVVYEQILRLWGLIPKGAQSHVDDLLRSLTNHFLAKSDAALDRIRIDLEANPKQTHWKPASWAIKDHPGFEIKYTAPVVDANAAGAMESEAESSSSASVVSDLSSSLQQMKFFALSTSYTSRLLNPAASADFEAPLMLGDAEEEIASQPSSLLILGRSGTGKTTIQLLRLFRLEMANRELLRQQQEAIDREQRAEAEAAAAAAEPGAEASVQVAAPRLSAKATLDGAYRGEVPIHQIMLTQSPQLRAQMRAQWKRMQRAEEDPAAEAAAAQPESKEDLERMGADPSASSVAPAAVDDVPSDFRKLHHTDFPLFLTANQLLMMLDGSNDRRYFKHEDAAAIANLPSFGEAPSVLNGHHEIDRMIDFHSFIVLYWKHFNTKLTAQFSPALMWTEIMARINCIPKFEQQKCIKVAPASAAAAAAASSSAPAQPTQFLSRAEYVSSAARDSALQVEDRERIYTLFESYREMKKDRCDFDLCDAVWFISAQLMHHPWRGVYVNKIYVDEVQDLLPSQLAMLSVFRVKEPENDLVFAGDTAQAITAGVAFKFTQLKDLFYNALIPAERHGVARVPKLSQLLTNYRSHAAVLNLANSLVQLMTHFFPSSIDPMSGEVSGMQGAIPMLILSKSKNQTLFGGAWGAEQVILVRDAATKKQLAKHNPEAQILTIAESKGLEFRDVLLYHFFSAAPESTRSALRLIYKFLRDRGVPLGPKQTPPAFDQLKHDELNTELKNLYVAITRARWNVWIVEENEESVAPMRTLWSHGQISDQAAAGAAMARPSSSLVQVIDNQSEIDNLILTVQSSPAEFARKAHELFDRAKWEHAAMLFRKGHQPEWEQKALAFASKQRGEQAALDVRAMRKDKCGTMELARIICDRKSAAAKAAYAELSQAGREFLALTPPLHREAALSFKACGEFSLAIDSFIAVRSFSLALELCLAMRPQQIERALDIAEQGHRPEDALAIALTHGVFLTLEQAARCIRWLTQCANAAVRSAWVSRALAILSSQIDAAKSPMEQELYSTIFGRLLNTQSSAEKTAQVERLERDGNLSVAAQVQEQIDPTQAAGKFALHGHLFKAVSIRLRASVASADASNRESVKILLEILRVGLALPLWLSQPMQWDREYRSIMEQCITQAEEGCPTPLQTTELRVMRALRRLTAAMHNGDAISTEVNPKTGHTPAQTVTSLLTSELAAVRVAEEAASSLEARAVTFRCRLCVLNALVRHCLRTVPSSRTPFVVDDFMASLQSHLTDWLADLRSLLVGVSAVLRGRAVNTAFRALEQLLGVPDSDDAHFRRVFVRPMDHPEVEAAQHAMMVEQQTSRKAVPLPFFMVSLLQECLPAGSKIAQVTADANAFKRFANVQLDHLCYLMRWTLLRSQASVLGECIELWQDRLTVTLPCTHLSLSAGKHCPACRLQRHATERGVDAAVVPVVLHAMHFLAQMQLRLSEVQTELQDAHGASSKRAAGQWMQRALSIVMLHADSTLWPPLATLRFRNPDSPLAALFEQRCNMLVEQQERSAAAPASLQPIPFRLSVLLELLLLCRLMPAEYAIPNASLRLPSAAPPPSIVSRKATLQSELRRRTKAMTEFVAKNKSSAHHKPKLSKMERQLRSDIEATLAESTALAKVECTSLLLASLAGALFQSLELQSRLQRASQLDLGLIFVQSNDAAVPAGVPASASSVPPPSAQPLVVDHLLHSVQHGSEALVQYYQQFILPPSAPNESHWYCLPRRTFDEQAHAACMPIRQFLHLAQHFTVLLICYFHRMRYLALPTSVALESMGDAASERLLSFVSESAQHATDADISEIGRLIHNMRDTLTDLLMHLDKRCHAFCSEDPAEGIRSRATAAAASSSSASSASPSWRLDAHTQSQFRRKLVMLLLTIGLNHSRESWTYCFRALQPDVSISGAYDVESLYAQHLPMLANLRQIPSPQSFGHFNPYPPFCLGWIAANRFRFPHQAYSIRKFETTARKTVVHVLAGVDPLIMLAADPAFIPAYLVGLIPAHIIVPRAFSLQAITGVAHQPLQQPVQAEAAAQPAPAAASSAALPASGSGADGEAPSEAASEDAGLSTKFDSIREANSAAKLVREARLTQALLRGQETVRDAARYGVLAPYRTRLLKRLDSARHQLTLEVSPEEQLRRRSQAWILEHAQDWSPEYRELFKVRVPNLAIKVNDHLREAHKFMAQQQDLKRKHEERARRDNATQQASDAAASSESAAGSSMSADDQDDEAASFDRFKNLLRLNPSASSDPYRLDHCAKLISGLEEARRLLNVSDPSHAAAVQSVDKLKTTLGEIAETIRTAVADMKSLAAGSALPEPESNGADPGQSNNEEEQQSAESKAEDKEEEEEKQTVTTPSQAASVRIDARSLSSPAELKSTLAHPHNASSSSSSSASSSSSTSATAAAARASSSMLASLAKSAAAAAAAAPPAAPAAAPIPAPVVAASSPPPQRCSKCNNEFVLSASDPPEITRCKPCREQAKLDRKKKKQEPQEVEAAAAAAAPEPKSHAQSKPPVVASAATAKASSAAPNEREASAHAASQASSSTAPQKKQRPSAAPPGANSSAAGPSMTLAELNELLQSKPTDRRSASYLERAQLLCSSTPPDYKAALSDADSFISNYNRAKRVGVGLTFELFPSLPLALYLRALCHSRLRNSSEAMSDLASFRGLMSRIDDELFERPQMQRVRQQAQALEDQITKAYNQRSAAAQANPPIFDRCVIPGEKSAIVQRWLHDGMLPCRLCSVQFVCDLDDLNKITDPVCADCRPEAARQAKAAAAKAAARAAQAEERRRVEQAKALEKQKQQQAEAAAAQRAAAQRAQAEQVKQQQAAKAAELARVQALAAQQAQRASQAAASREIAARPAGPRTSPPAPALPPSRAAPSAPSSSAPAVPSTSQPQGRQSCKPAAAPRRVAPDDDEEEDEDDDLSFARRLGHTQSQHALQDQARSAAASGSSKPSHPKQGGAGVGNSVNSSKLHVTPSPPPPAAPSAQSFKTAATAVVASGPAATPSSGLDPLAELREKQQRALEQLQREQELEFQQAQVAIAKRRAQEAAKANNTPVAAASQPSRTTPPPTKVAAAPGSAPRPSSAASAAAPTPSPRSGFIRGRVTAWKNSVLGVIAVSSADAVQGQREFLFHMDQASVPADQLREGTSVEFKIFVSPKDGRMFANAVRPAAAAAKPTRGPIRTNPAAAASVASLSVSRPPSTPARSWGSVPVPVAVSLRAQSREEIETDLATRLSLQPQQQQQQRQQSRPSASKANNSSMLSNSR